MTYKDNAPLPPRPLILLVDDTPRNLQVLGNILKKQAYHLAVATNGFEALERIKEVRPDLILLDIMMPDLSGFEVCEVLKKDETTRDIPVIFLTAKTETEDIVHGFELGAVDYITKPFNGVELLARVKTHLTLKETRDALANALASKDRFFSIISHDLRSPFSTIVSFLKLVDQRADQYSKEDILELTQELRAKADTTMTLLENLLQWARAQTGGLCFEPAAINAEVLFNTVIEVMHTAASMKNITLTQKLEPGLAIFADPNMLATVLRNLLSNAIKFTREGGRVEISGHHLEDEVEIIVSDNGVGMSEKIMEKIFRLDTKMTTDGTDNERGSGLGLILCQTFIHQHGGRIWAESEKGKGSRFIMRLPNQRGDIN